MNKIGRMTELDGLRGLAALAVVFYHFTTHYERLFHHAKEQYFLNFKFGFLGVQLFFIVSGFVIFMTINNTVNLKSFAIKRAVRLYPAYIISVILTFTAVNLYELKGMDSNLKDGLLNLTMFQGFMPGVNHVDGSYWTLTVEITFYIIVGLIFKLGLLKKIEMISILWLSMSFLIKIINRSVHSGLLQILDSFLAFGYCNLFIAGIMFYKIKSENKLKYHIILIACLAYEFFFNSVFVGTVVSGFFLLFYALIFGKLRFMSNKVFVYFGTISYSLYLVHQNIGFIIIDFIEKQGFTNEVYIIVPVLSSIGIASLITFFVEHPLQKVIRNKRPLGLLKKSKYKAAS